MRLSVFALVSSLYIASVTALPSILERGGDIDLDDVNGASQPRICPHLKVKGGGCVRYVRGFDITGVTTEIDLLFPQIKDLCSCIKYCLDHNTTCNNYVWKFSDANSVMTGHRTCTLYSNFILPANVTVEFDVNNKNNVNIQPLTTQNNPQVGQAAPEAFKDKNLNTTFDDDAVSGPLWLLGDGSIVC